MYYLKREILFIILVFSTILMICNIMYDKELKKFIQNTLKEDIGIGDITSLSNIDKKSLGKASLLIKDDGIIAGIELAKLFFSEIDKNLKIKNFMNDGKKVKNGDLGFIVEGNLHAILSAERSVLNCMQRMSAIATKTNEYCNLISDTNTKILDTRKTTPLNRLIEKWAVKIGGGVNHRFGLYDLIMIKDNHIDFVGDIKSTIEATQKYLQEKQKKIDIIVEARDLDEVEEILESNNIKRILLDNFNFGDTKKAVEIIGDKCETESSGGITKENIRGYALCGVTYVSIGDLTHSVSNFDLSLNAI